MLESKIAIEFPLHLFIPTIQYHQAPLHKHYWHRHQRRQKITNNVISHNEQSLEEVKNTLGMKTDGRNQSGVAEIPPAALPAPFQSIFLLQCPSSVHDPVPATASPTPQRGGDPRQLPTFRWRSSNSPQETEAASTSEKCTDTTTATNGPRNRCQVKLLWKVGFMHW